jgi:hypothetical protein
MTSQFSLLLKSVSLLRKNPVLLVPSLLYYAASIPLSLVLYAMAIPVALLFVATKSIVLTALAGTVAFLIYMLSITIAYSFWIAATGGMMCDIALLGRTAFDRGLKHAKNFWKKMFWLFLAYFVLFLLLFVVVAIPVLLMFSSFPAGVFLGVAVYTLLSLLLWGATFFSLPIALLGRASGFGAIRASFRYSLEHPGHVFATLATLVLVTGALMVIMVLLMVPVVLFSGTDSTSGALVGITASLLMNLLVGILSFVATIILLLFVFLSWLNRNPSKWKATSSAR